jgi:hypothetical protein
MNVGPWERDPTWKRRMSKAYLLLHREVSAALYEEDPEGFGSTIGSPEDEYETEAARLIASISQLEGDVAAAVASNFSQAPERLIQRVEAAWRRYKRQSASDTAEPS